MPRPILATISTSAMAHNLSQVKARIEFARKVHSSINQQCLSKIVAVIKANAYGHGTLNALIGFKAADALGMIDLVDGILCRDNGWTKPIILLEGFFDSQDIEILQHYQLTTAIHHQAQIAYLNEAKNVGKPIDVLVKFNTGMNRLGFHIDQAKDVLVQLNELKAKGIVGRIGAMSHFANADLESIYVNDAAQKILAIAPQFDGQLSICNSAASIRYPYLALQHHENWVRPGICLYGSSPFDTELSQYPSVDFRPTMTLEAKVIAIQQLKAGDKVGYGSLFTADQPMKMAVVACGYADGYPRSAPQNTPVMVDGVAASIIGRVSMDMITVDVTHIPSAQVNSRVVFWGDGGPTIDEVAKATGRIGYEIMCNLAKRVPIKVV
ncbi:alanine racemase [Pelistega sp. MC2]|uniref:alanine racemase n=1 Tax=Pelistega sp. MC2 TaxID=1720297 RepID=UPI0008D97717|nr:alanine racemase [Pelistega sp. MC2]